MASLIDPYYHESKEVEVDDGKFKDDAEAAISPAPSQELGIKPSKAKLEDFIFFANAQRIAERNQDGKTKRTLADKLQSFASPSRFSADSAVTSSMDIQTANLDSTSTAHVDAWRVLRQASWISAFYLCTTDILGPFNAPYAFRQNGYVPGILLYIFMGGTAFYCGALLWWLYIKLDSDRYPVKSYSDITERVAGRAFRVFVTWLVFIHMIVNVATTSLSAAQSLVQIVGGGKLCFIVAVVIWILVGMVLNQIRTLSRFSYVASLAIWLNILVILLSVGFIAHSPPNYASAKAAYGIPQGAVVKQTFATYPFYERINGVMNIVYAYGGATIFAQIIAEMRRPMEFLKSFSLAQAIIFAIYVFYGLYVYSFQGQFTLPVAFQGVSHHSWQTVGNVLSLISVVIAGGLYGNVGLKIFYVNVIEDLFHGPLLTTRRGRITWSITVIIFWAVGFIIGAAIPQIQTLSGMVGAVTNMQFTYSFPTGFAFLYMVQQDACAEDGEYVPGEVSRVDNWFAWSRWKRGLFGGSTATLIFKWTNFILCLAALATAGLGIYGSGLSIKAAFKTSAATSFGCSAPV